MKEGKIRATLADEMQGVPALPLRCHASERDKRTHMACLAAPSAQSLDLAGHQTQAQTHGRRERQPYRACIWGLFPGSNLSQLLVRPRRRGCFRRRGAIGAMRLFGHRTWFRGGVAAISERPAGYHTRESIGLQKVTCSAVLGRLQHADC